ncbi:MAG: class IV adenylate cyclase [Proteobacteria bacterium]|nr:class IV adenylate cyclase [Pseudomonadota bacterium]
MALEIEVKYLNADHADLRQRLSRMGAHGVGRWFEANVVFDDAARSLKAAGTLLRLREKSGRVVLTLKCASAENVSDAVKVCDEHETDVADAASMRQILAGLGLTPALRYEKLREKWLVLGCEVCLDTLPFGDFVEIEGSEEDIATCAKALELQSDRASTATYHDLNRQHRESSGLPPEESFVFDDAAKSRLLARRATDGSGKFELDPLDMRPRSA